MEYWVAFWTALPGTILALTALIVVVKSWFGTKDLVKTVKKIGKQTNGMHAAIVKSSRKEGFDAGKIAEKRKTVRRKSTR